MVWTPQRLIDERMTVRVTKALPRHLVDIDVDADYRPQLGESGFYSHHDDWYPGCQRAA